MQADSIVENYVNGSPIEEISYNFEIPEETIRLVLEYAGAKQKRKTAVPA